MNYEEIQNKVILTNYDSFDIEDILECGQCFRFYKLGEKEYKIIAFNRILNIKQSIKDKYIEFYPCDKKSFEDIWIDYFDLKRDYKKIKKILLKRDNILKEAIEFANGIRILKQDIFECLISFIISQNNRIYMIKNIIQNISCSYGTKIYENDYAFPTITSLSKITEEDLRLCKTGFRAKYIKDAIQKILNKEIILDNFNNMDTKDLKEKLMTINGVGIKVSDCVLLFSNRRFEVFPTDVWIKRVMEYFYFNNQIVNIKEIHKLAKEKWGDYAGFAQQYLFHYARYKKIGK